VKHRLDLTRETIKPIVERIGEYDLEKIALRDVAPLLACAETVDHSEIRVAGLIQPRGEAMNRPPPVIKSIGTHPTWSSDVSPDRDETQVGEECPNPHRQHRRQRALN
jgi:hypothetical protein